MTEPTALATAFSPDRPLVLVGAGSMGGAMLVGWLRAGLDPKAIVVIDPAPPPETLAVLRDIGVEATASPSAGLSAGTLILAVKPNVVAELLPILRPLMDPSSVAITIVAGVGLATIKHGLGTRRVVRAMPNTPALIGEGISVVVADRGVDLGTRDLVTQILSPAGSVEWIDEESLMDAATAVSGSGPAYVFLLAESLADAGIDVGLEPALARRLADATISGAGALLAVSGDDPATLRQKVTSPGGTTAAALDVLMSEGGMASLMREAVRAAKARAQELA